MRFATGALAALVAAAGLSACGASPQAVPTATVTVTTPGPTVTATVTATPEPVSLGATDDGRLVAPIVADVNDLREHLKAFGLCEEWEVVADGIAATCKGGILINAFSAEEAGRELHRAAVSAAHTAILTQGRDDVALLVGPNWFLRVDTAGAYTLQGLMGGSVVGI